VTEEADFRRAAARYRKTKAQHEDSTQALHAAMRAARDAGMTLSAMADAIGVSRQRVMDILKR
jgi:DNA-binding XRE family transcriptional regulator